MVATCCHSTETVTLLALRDLRASKQPRLFLDVGADAQSIECMRPHEWQQTRATGRGRPVGSEALEAYRNFRAAEKERLAGLATAGVENEAAYAAASEDVVMNMASVPNALVPVEGKRSIRSPVTGLGVPVPVQS